MERSVLHGLIFLALGHLSANRNRWNAERRKQKQRDSAARTMTLRLKRLTDKEQAIVNDIQRQLTDDPARHSRRKCPECGRPFVVVSTHGVTIDACRYCRGCWFDPGELRMFTGLDKDIPGDTLRSRTSKYRCPVCEQTMTEHVFLKPFNLLVDGCPQKHGVYLEDRELRRVFEIV